MMTTSLKLTSFIDGAHSLKLKFKFFIITHEQLDAPVFYDVNPQTALCAISPLCRSSKLLSSMLVASVILFIKLYQLHFYYGTAIIIIVFLFSFLFLRSRLISSQVSHDSLFTSDHLRSQITTENIKQHCLDFSFYL